MWKTGRRPTRAQILLSRAQVLLSPFPWLWKRDRSIRLAMLDFGGSLQAAIYGCGKVSIAR
ncbi:MAG TPA: hypothetical protein VKI99_10050 [Candidatus Dormibacteraeota bacterium]|nr:hypothetical protein [Candidatus Dormibacteraeota bacterium]